MFPFEHHRNVLRSGEPSDLIGDLLAQSLLQLQAMRELVRNPREFREAQHFVVGDVPNGDPRIWVKFRPYFYKWEIDPRFERGYGAGPRCLRIACVSMSWAKPVQGCDCLL